MTSGRAAVLADVPSTTLLHMAVGLLAPTAGSVLVLGGQPGAPGVRSKVGFVAQDKPLYPRFTVSETLRMGGWLNPGGFDMQRASGHLTSGDST